MTSHSKEATKPYQYKTLFVAMALSVVALNARALTPNEIAEGQQPLLAEFKQLDTNTDMTLSPLEASKDAYFTKADFTKADVNQDGLLSQDEYTEYRSADQKQKLAVLIDDSTITAKAKAELLTEKDLKSLPISVETLKGQVILSGFVDNQMTKQKAEAIVKKIDGVKSVKNSLVVKRN